MLHDLHMADATTSNVVLDATTSSPCTLFQRFLLNMSAMYHAIPYRKWFSTYLAMRHGCADTDTLSRDVVGVGVICLVFADGASLLLHDVRHILTLTQCWCLLHNCEIMVMRLGIERILGRYRELRL